MKNVHQYLIIHHSVSNRDNTSVEDIDSWHKARWSHFKSSLGYWAGYGYIITGNGKVTQTRNDDEEQAHAIGWNIKSIGIALTGNFNDWALSPQQDNALKVLLNRLRAKYKIPLKNVLSHNEIDVTQCPGKNLEKLIKKYKTPNLVSLQRQLMILTSLIQRLMALLKILRRK